MKNFQYEIHDALGLHARPAGLLVREAKKFQSKIKITNNEKTVAATQLLGIMGMAIKKGAIVTVTVEGEDEEIAFSAMKQFFDKNL